MSLNLLKRELEKDVLEFDESKVKHEVKLTKKRKKEKKTANSVFNDTDYTKEDDFTKQCLRNIGLLDGNVSVASDKIVKYNHKVKRQVKPEAARSNAAEPSIFTDEDFEVVNKLHFVNSKKAVILDETGKL